MHLATIIRLKTQDTDRPDHYAIFQTTQGWMLRTGDLTIVRPTLAKIFFILGGMVDYRVWGENSQDLIRFYNDGKLAI